MLVIELSHRTTKTKIELAVFNNQIVFKQHASSSFREPTKQINKTEIRKTDDLNQ